MSRSNKVAKKPKEEIYSNRIRQILYERQMTPQELSDISGILPSHLSRIINGQRKCISLPTAMKVAEALKMSVEEIFIYKKPQNESNEL